MTEKEENISMQEAQTLLSSLESMVDEALREYLDDE
jgi:hypothetical protein